jgi:pilus assembly protein FimV
MVALYEENPQAFMGGNINRLKRGAKLRIPSDGDFDQVSQREALRLIREHELAWREGRDINRSVVDTSPANSQSRSTATSNTSQSGRLSLATEQQSDSGTGGSNAAISEEENLVLKQQNQELEDEKRSQDERIEQLERLLELKNQQLAQLQNTTSDSDQTAQNTTITDTAVSDTTSTQAQTQAENTADQTEQATQPTPTRPSPMPEKGFVDQLLDGTYNLYLIILGVIIIVIVLIMRFRGKDDLSYQDAIERSVPDNAPKSQSNAFRAEDLPDTADEVLADDSESYTADDIAMEESADPVGEADIYMAYGKFDQAEDLLKRALTREPDRADLHAKLLECYSEMDSMASFEAHLDDVAPLIQSDSELSQMVEEVYTTTWPKGEYYNKQTSAEESAEVSAEIGELSDELDAEDLPSAEDVFGDIDDADASDIIDELGEVDLDMDAGIAIDEAPEAEEPDDEDPDAEESSDTEETDAEEADADSDSDIDTQLDLASAYIEMGDFEGAREIIEEVLTTGDAKQKEQAQTLLDSIEN